MLYRIILPIVLSVFSFNVSFAALDKENKDRLELLVNERWNKIIDYDFGSAYDYETPNYKAVFTKDLYAAQFSHGVAWELKKIEAIKYDVASKIATVSVLVETRPRNSKGLDATVKTASVEIREKWLHIKGRWWHSSSE